MFRCFAVFLLFIAVASCKPEIFHPKPPGYFRIDTPDAHQYRVFDEPGYPYSFEYPVYATIEKDTIFMGEKAENPYWINIVFPSLNGMVNITYKEISAKQPLLKLVDDAWGLSFFHHEKADYIQTKEFSTPGNADILYVVGGNTASRYQFTATDSTRHFIRGALYFDVTPNADSLKPANDFLEKDIKHMLMTLKWK